MPNNLPSYVKFSDHLSEDVLNAISTINPDKIALLVDENTKLHCQPKLDIAYDHLLEIKSGETQKNLNTCDYLWDCLTKANFSRKSLLINLGGGVIGDMGGFVAATYKRGIAFINLPTTLLSQVDASIGGKLGIDFRALKNHIGLFKEPEKVIIHPEFIHTLPRRELLSGFAEVIKHALIRDASYWQEIQSQSIDDMDWKKIIKRSVEIKQEVVSQDPLEDRLRKTLNFGHTFGHAIESLFLHTENPLLHGEAIALGMILEANLSLELNMISNETFNDIFSFLTHLYDLPSILEFDELEYYLLQDKKNIGGKIKFSLLNGIGECSYNDEVSKEAIIKSLEYWNQIKRS